MPAAQLELDAHSMDRQLLDGSSGHVQLLLAVMKAGDWEHALLMLDWLQVCVSKSVIFFCVITHFLNLGGSAVAGWRFGASAAAAGSDEGWRLGARAADAGLAAGVCQKVLYFFVL
jgi:hypothetical protein